MKIGDFINYLKSEVNIGIYVWGANGELLTDISPAWIKKHEDSTENCEKAVKMYEIRKNVKGARAFDCSGLVCWALRECSAEPKGFDKTADGLRQMCTRLSRNQLSDGDLCFKIKDNKAHHVGVWVNGKIIEAKGRAYGVVSSAITSSWNGFGRLNIKWDDEPIKWVLTRVLRKGDNDKKQGGHDVENMQKLLIAKGYKLKKYGADGDFGTETLTQVKKFQREHGLDPDGAVGKLTITALGGQWK